MHNGNVITNLTLKNASCVPEFKCNLHFTSKATVNNLLVLSKERYSKTLETNDSIAVQAVRYCDLYDAYIRNKRTAIAWVSDFVKWHFKLGHLKIWLGI